MDNTDPSETLPEVILTKEEIEREAEEIAQQIDKTWCALEEAKRARPEELFESGGNLYA